MSVESPFRSNNYYAVFRSIHVPDIPRYTNHRVVSLTREIATCHDDGRVQTTLKAYKTVHVHRSNLSTEVYRVNKFLKSSTFFFYPLKIKRNKMTKLNPHWSLHKEVIWTKFTSFSENLSITS